MALSVREAAGKAKTDTLNGMSVTAQFTFDRASLMQGMLGGLGSFDRDNFDMNALRGNVLTLDDYTEYEIMKIFRKLADEGKCVIIVTHSPDVAKAADVRYEIAKSA